MPWPSKDPSDYTHDSHVEPGDRQSTLGVIAVGAAVLAGIGAVLLLVGGAVTNSKELRAIPSPPCTSA